MARKSKSNSRMALSYKLQLAEINNTLTRNVCTTYVITVTNRSSSAYSLIEDRIVFTILQI